MPLIKIDVQDHFTPEQQAQLGDAIHVAIVRVLGIPERDKFQIITTHPSGQIVAQDAGLGFERTNNVLMIQIFTQRGRSEAVKQHLFREIQSELATVGIAPEDVFIGYFENGPSDWSFGFGRAQYLTGELAVPGKQAISQPA